MELREFITLIMQVTSPGVLLWMILGTFTGIIIGAMPGLTTTMGVALILPVVYSLPPLPGILVMIAVYCASTYGGSISAILLNTPGTPAAAATALDGHQMARRGEAGRALGLALVSSILGGLISALALTLFASYIASFALRFGPAEYFGLGFIGLSMSAYVSGKSPVKGMIAACIGLILAIVGVDPMMSTPRLTFGSPFLAGGIAFIPVLIGVFAIPEVFSRMFDTLKEEEVIKGGLRVFIPLRDLLSHKVTLLRSAVIGVVVGAIPATGPDIAAFVSYGVTKQLSDNPAEFGKGKPQGIIASEAANNGCTGGALITGLSLGIPGDAAVAIIMAGMAIQGIMPGPLLFQTSRDLVNAIFVGMFLTQIMFGIIGFLGCTLFVRALLVPKKYLYPVIFVFSVLGAYSLRGFMGDVVLMLVTGIAWFYLSKRDFPGAPVCLGLILGPMMEANFRRALIISKGSYSIFYTHPILVVTMTLALLVACFPMIKRLWMKRRTSYLGQ